MFNWPQISPRAGVATAAAAALLAAGVAAAVPAQAAAYSTQPKGLVCLTYNASSGTGVARLGADNSGIAIDIIPQGDYNYLYPGPWELGQPAQFAPGNSSWDYTFQAGQPGLTWYLNRQPSALIDFTAANLPFDRPCPDQGPSITAVSRATIASGSGQQQLTVFGRTRRNHPPGTVAVVLRGG